MKSTVLPLLLLFLLPVVSSSQANKPRLIKPSAEAVPVLIMQQDAPLKIEKAEFLLLESDSGNLLAYSIRNVSSKPIKSFEISAVSLRGGASSWSGVLKDQHLLMPDRALYSLENTTYEIVPNVEKPASASHPTETKAVWIVMVERVVFADGTCYDAKGVSNSLQEFLERSLH
jgi:hypothetical protein